MIVLSDCHLLMIVGMGRAIDKVKNVPVNYRIQFSDLVTTPSPPAVVPAQSSAKYKDAFVPRRFFNSSVNFVLSFPFSYVAVVPQAAASSTFPLPRPLFPIEGYDAASEKSASSQLPALIR
jgi:hypothetical protein